MHLNVSEYFGPTIQGEGRHAGQLSSFFRLAGCNLTCSWCDSKYTWDWDNYDRSKEVHRVELKQAAKILSELPGRLIFTGGEPLMQRAGLARLFESPALRGRKMDVETNGLRDLGPTAPYWDTVICSPKVIPSADVGEKGWQIADSVLAVADFKVVVHDQADLDAMARFVAAKDISADRVWIMPEGTTVEELNQRTPWLMDEATARGWNFTSRLQVYGWADKRGH